MNKSAWKMVIDILIMALTAIGGYLGAYAATTGILQFLLLIAFVNQFACQNPQKVKNPYTGDWLYVPCGKCALCKSKRAAHWTERLEFERSCHPYCLFGTLTYNEDFLPKVYLTDDGFLDGRSGELIPFNEIQDYVDTDSIKFVRSRGFLPVGDVRDTQLFIKRLRERIRVGKSSGCPDSIDRPEDRYCRYFLVNEFGPSTFRPHYHFLIFTASKWFAEHAKSIVSACWSTDNRYSDSKELGIVDVQNVQTSASAYVASYLNSFTDLPRLFQFPAFRAFKIFSKHPPLGTLLPSSKEIQALFDSGSPKMSVYRRKSNDFVETPIPKGLCSRLYPKVTGFDKFSYDVLTGLYSLPSDISQSSFEAFRELARRRSKMFNDGVADYFKYIFKNLSETESSLHQIFSCLRRVNLQSRIFGVSVRQYFDKIYAFYSNQDYQRLSDFYKYYEDYSKDYSCSNMLLNDRIHLDFLTKSFKDSDNIYPELIIELKNYGYDEDLCTPLDFLESISPETDFNYVSAVSKANKCIQDSCKKKAKNDYLEHRKMDAEFKQFLINYHSKNGLSEYNEGVG